MRKETDEGPCAGSVGRLGAQAPVRNQPTCTASYRHTFQYTHYEGALNLVHYITSLPISFMYLYVSRISTHNHMKLCYEGAQLTWWSTYISIHYTYLNT